MPKVPRPKGLRVLAGRFGRSGTSAKTDRAATEERRPVLFVVNV